MSTLANNSLATDTAHRIHFVSCGTLHCTLLYCTILETKKYFFFFIQDVGDRRPSDDLAQKSGMDISVLFLSVKKK